MTSRISANNRAKRGGVPPSEFADLLASLHAQEAAIERELHHRYRVAVPKPIRDWQRQTVGLGEHTLARLLGVLGDPYQAFPWHWEGQGKDDRHLVPDPPYERTIAQLWSYCGVGDPARKRRRGMTVEDALACGSPRLRSLLFVIAEGVIKQIGEPDKRGRVRARSPYRGIYDARRLATAERVHTTPCARCGTRGKPADEGTPWRLAHKHADALRIVAKEVLRDLWLVAREAKLEAESKDRSPLSPLARSDDAATPDAKPNHVAPPVTLG